MMRVFITELLLSPTIVEQVTDKDALHF